MNYPKMLHDRVLIKPDEVKEDETMFVTQDKPKSNTGTVCSVGDGFVGISNESNAPIILTIPLTVKVGDKVKYDYRMFDDFVIDGKVFIDGKERDIKCIIK